MERRQMRASGSCLRHRRPRGLLRLVPALLLLASLSVAAAELPAQAFNGDTVDAPESRAGFLVYFAPMRIWVDPDVFWYRWADEQRAFLWNGAPEPPAGPEVEEGNMFIIETDSGPCLLVRESGRWRQAGAVFRWSERLRRYAGCAGLPEVLGE